VQALKGLWLEVNGFLLILMPYGQFRNAHYVHNIMKLLHLIYFTSHNRIADAGRAIPPFGTELPNPKILMLSEDCKLLLASFLFPIYLIEN
jgi:hypothetical protein